jgi:hypothetical protein
VSTPRKPDLDQLIAALTADGRPEELTGRETAIAAFRAASRRDAADGPGRRRRVSVRHSGTKWSPRLAAVGVVMIVAAGVAASAYTHALPGPAQDFAHTVFAPLGVPGNQQPSGHPAAVTTSTSGGKSGRSRGASSTTPSPRPGNAYFLTLTTSRVRVPAGAVIELSGRVTDHGRPVAGAPVRLFERLAGSTDWEPVASGVTGPRGGFRLLSPPLTKTAVFRVAGPDAKHSAAVRVAVADPQVTAGAT